jgi:hypothetical protein
MGTESSVLGTQLRLVKFSLQKVIRLLRITELAQEFLTLLQDLTKLLNEGKESWAALTTNGIAVSLLTEKVWAGKLPFPPKRVGH